MSEKEILIDSREVENVFQECLCGEEKIENTVTTQGIRKKYKFSSSKLEKNRRKIFEWLEILPKEFSFSEANKQENGAQWTSSYVLTEQFLCLGISLRLVRYKLPRKEWGIFPDLVVEIK